MSNYHIIILLSIFLFLTGCSSNFLLVSDSEICKSNIYQNRKETQVEIQNTVMACRVAANNGDSFAQNELGIFYEKGFGVKKNTEKAINWYKRAASNGYPSGASNYQRLMQEIYVPPIVPYREAKRTLPSLDIYDVPVPQYQEQKTEVPNSSYTITKPDKPSEHSIKEETVEPEPKGEINSSSGVGNEISTNFVLKVINSLSPDLDMIYEEANEGNSELVLIIKNILKSSFAGGASASIPVASIAIAPLDFGYLLKIMSDVSYGIGALKEKNAGCGNQLEHSDIYAVLGIWSATEGIDEIVTEIEEKLIAEKAAHDDDSVDENTLKKILERRGLIIAKKMGVGLSETVAKKFVTKLAVKTGGRFVPFAGIAINAFSNGWFVGDFANAAQGYYSVRTILCR